VTALRRGRALALAAARLERAAVPSPRREAELLLALALDRPRLAWLHREDDAPLPREAARRFVSLVNRRCAREPFAYLAGRKGFLDFELEVGPGVLVPRPETETLVEAAAAGLAGGGGVVVDAGTGSGCVAIGLARRLPHAALLAIDRSAAALSYARANVSRLALAGRVTLLRADLRDLANLVSRGSLAGLVSNPPYVAADAVRDELRHEPRDALVDAGGGFPSIYAALIGAARHGLREGGTFAVEVGQGQADEVARLATHAGLSLVAIECDLAGIPRVVTARR
jgi:release factor glutamine methyltransferase